MQSSISTFSFSKRPVSLRKAIFAAALISLNACEKAPAPTEGVEVKPVVEKSKVIANEENFVSAQALELAKKYLIVDTHVDVPYRLEEFFEDVSQSTEKGDFDYPRAMAGGLNAPFMSIYIPAKLQVEGGSKELADSLIDMVEKIANGAPNKYRVAYSTQDVETAQKAGVIALPLGMENGSPIEGKLENLQHFQKRGIRYITLTHSKANHISDSSYDPERPAGGLTNFGKELILEMNRLGVMVDVSHISDDAFNQVMDITQVPVIASHSSARHFTPGFERNMSDAMIKRLAEKGGVIQINFGSTFISQTSIEHYNLYKADLAEYLKANNLKPESDEATAFSKKYNQDKPFPFASLDNVLDHFDHVVKLVGIDYVGIGSDYDGVGDSLPVQLKDVSSYPNLVQGLLNRNYSEADIAKILGGNLMRVWKQNEAYAEKLATQTVE